MTKTTSTDARSILLVEDDEEFANEIKSELDGLGYCVRLISIADVADAARVDDVALMIMNRIVLGDDSLEALKVLRKDGIKVPVPMISALSSVDDIVQALKAGGDHYLTRPFAMVELVARVEAVLRRLDDVRATKLRGGDLEMDLIEHTVHRGDAKIDPVPREFKLLEFFLRHPGEVITRAMLLKAGVAIPFFARDQRRRCPYLQPAKKNRREVSPGR